MKNLFKAALFTTITFAAAQTYAQEHHESVGHQIGHTAKNVGHKTSEIAAKGAATVTDKRYKDRYSMSGEAVYINSHAQYFYINKLGHRVYLKKSETRYKPSH